MASKPSDSGSSTIWFIDIEDQGQQPDEEEFEEAVKAVVENLGPETQLTGPDIPGDVLLHAWPKVSPEDELKGLTNPRMSMELVVMVVAEAGIDSSVLEKELVRGGEGERVVIVGIVCGGVLRVMLSEEGVPGGIADLV
ncbi:hypothetical protein C0993_011081 [Termitomyces sp. T159_Od127]|nr:hypothetical protein C0993_011081 [Termitomyces sp. T159_Od127]